MAVRAAPSGMVGIPLNPVSPSNGTHPSAHPTRGDLELLGTLLRDRPARNGNRVATLSLDNDETVRALRLLALDNLIDIVGLRERLLEREAQLTSVTKELKRWRAQALNESALRKTETARARHHERELVTVLHRQMVDIDVLSAELSWRRQPWWRRPAARRAASATPAPSSAPR
jgi:hypothetical protein